MTTTAVGPDAFVTFTYAVFEKDGTEPVDAIDGDEPIEYIHGYGQILPVLEKNLLGKEAGAKFTVEVGPEEAFGEHDTEGVFEVDREGLDVGDPQVDDELHAKDADGHVLVLRILEVRPETIVVDANHPLAGKSVRFEVEVIAVREANDEEIDVAQQEVEAMAAMENDHEHGPNCNHDHDHDHDHDHADPADAGQGLVTIGRKTSGPTEGKA